MARSLLVPLLLLVALLAPPLAAARVLPPLRETVHHAAVAAEGVVVWAADAALDPVQDLTAPPPAPMESAATPQASSRAAPAPDALVAWPWLVVEGVALLGLVLALARVPLARLRRTLATRALRLVLLLALGLAGAALALVQSIVPVEPAWAWVAAGAVAWVALLAGALAAARTGRAAPAFRLAP